MDYEKICRETIDLAKQTGTYIKDSLGKLTTENIETKGKHNFVTTVDKFAEQKLVTGLGKILPEAGFIAEEGTSDRKGERYDWIIDPLDGTTNFIHGASPVAVSIALKEKDEMVIGVIYEIFSGECFYACKGGKAYMNGKEIQVSKIDSVSGSLIATGFPYQNFNRLEPFMESLSYLFNNSHGVRRLGSAATDLAYVACGRYEAFYEYNLNPWDVGAGIFIIQQAGGKVSDFKGGKNYLFGGEIVAANSNVFAEFLKEIGKFMNR